MRERERVEPPLTPTKKDILERSKPLWNSGREGSRMRVSMRVVHLWWSTYHAISGRWD